MTSALSTAKVARNEPVVWSITSPRGATITDSDAGQPGSSKGDTSVKVAVIGAIALVVAAGVTAALQKIFEEDPPEPVPGPSTTARSSRLLREYPHFMRSSS